MQIDLYGSGAASQAIKTFTLPVSGSVVLIGPEVAVVETKEFQRLAGLRQLGTSYVVFRGALHTRFEHSLGALHQAEKMLTAIENNPREGQSIDPAARRLARLGALLHDLPHVPFGHTLEDELKLLQRHDVNEARIERLLINSEIGEILRDQLAAGEFDELVRVLEAKKPEDFSALRFPFVGDIVGNTVCADLLDYVQRDLAGCGLPVALGDRFLDFLSISDDSEAQDDRGRIVLNLDKRGMPRPDVESEVVKLLAYRYELAERVYFHHAKNAASVMIGRAVQDAGLASGPDSPPELDSNFDWLSDEMLLHCLARPAIADAFELRRVEGTSEANIELAAGLAQAVLDRQMFKIAYIGVHDDVAVGASRIESAYGTAPARTALEDELAARAGLAPGDVLVHVPKVKMMRKAADVRVRTSTGEIITLNEWDAMHSGRVESLNLAHERLWRIAVYIRPEKIGAIDLVRAAAEEKFKGASRYVPVSRLGPYDEAVFQRHQGQRGWTMDDYQSLRDNGIAAFAEGGTLEAAINTMDAAIVASRAEAAPSAHNDASTGSD